MKKGDKVRYLRVQNDLTQKELAEKLGIKQNTLSDYERNVVPISLNTIEKLSKIFDVEQAYFLHEEDPKNFNLNISNKMILEDMVDNLIKRGDIKNINDIDKYYADLFYEILKKDVEDKLKGQL